MSNPGNINTQLELGPVGLGLRKIAQTIKVADFTDGGSTAGTLTLTPTLPAGAFFVGCKASVKTGFTGDTSAVLKVGKTSGEDEFCDGGTLNVYAAGDVGEEGEAPLEFLNSATTVYLQLTSASDFTLVTAGQMQLELFYLSTEVELTAGYPNKND
jgi:hypothetical protein